MLFSVDTIPQFAIIPLFPREPLQQLNQTKNMQYTEKVITDYLKGEKRMGNSPRCFSQYYGHKVTSMSFSECTLYSYSTVIAKVDRTEKVIYRSVAKYSPTTTRQQNDLERLGFRMGFTFVDCNDERELFKIDL